MPLARLLTLIQPQFCALISHVQLKSKSYISKQWKPIAAFSNWHWRLQGTCFVILCRIILPAFKEGFWLNLLPVYLCTACCTVQGIKHKGVKSILVFIMSVLVLNSLECQSDWLASIMGRSLIPSAVRWLDTLADGSCSLSVLYGRSWLLHLTLGHTTSKLLSDHLKQSLIHWLHTDGMVMIASI
jgi:hypothetical protein